MKKVLAYTGICAFVLSIALNVFLARNIILTELAIGEWLDANISIEQEAYSHLAWDNPDKAKEVLADNIRKMQMAVYGCEDEVCLEQLGKHIDPTQP